MGQQQIIPYKEYEKEYAMISQSENGQMLVKHKQTNKQFKLRKVIVNSQQELQERLKLLNRRKKIKNDHLLNIVNFKPIKDDRFCLGAMYVSLLIEYPFESLYYEMLHRLAYHETGGKGVASRVVPLYFQEHELWSILYSCTLGLQALYASDMPHQGISKNMIFIDKDGVVKIGDPILLGSRANYDKAIEIVQQQRKKQDQLSKNGSRNNFYQWQDTNMKSTSNSNHRGKSTSRRHNNNNYSAQKPYNNNPTPPTTKKNPNTTDSLIISPQLISFCKDNQSYYYDKEKSDVYVLGAMMVELALLENVFAFQYKGGKVNGNLGRVVEDQWGRLKERYSSAFLDIVSEMINVDPKKRPTFIKISEMIQEFSIQQNSQSDPCIHKNLSQSQQAPHNQSQNLLNRYVFNDQPQITHQQPINTNPIIDNPTSFRTGNTTNRSTQLPTYNNSNTQQLYNNSQHLLPQGVKYDLTSHQFPSFSLQKNPISLASSNFPSVTNSIEHQQQQQHQSVVKQQTFSNNFQIKLVQSPLIMPVSNIRGKLNVKHTRTYEKETPFRNLNLTESNQQCVRKDNDRESIVKEKITLFGHNSITGDQLMTRFNLHKQQQPCDYPTHDTKSNQRFSLNRFGRIELTKNSDTSENTSTVPTPRFQNPFNNGSNRVSDGFNNYGMQLQTSYNNDHLGFRSGAGQRGNGLGVVSNNGLVLTNANNNGSTLVENNKINAINLQHKPSPILSTYNPKKQGFSISEEIKEGQLTSSMKKSDDPYYSNSSVGYTLPKYRPQSTSSQVIKSVTHQRGRASSARIPKHQFNNLQQRVSKPDNVFKQTQSFLQRTDSCQHLLHPYKQITSYTDTTPGLFKLMNQKNETYSICSSQNTVRKNNHSTVKNSAKRKYDFYKKQMTQQLEKISTPSPPQKKQQPQLIQTNFKQNHFLSSTSIKKQPEQYPTGMKKQQSKIQIQYQPESHSVYVDQKQPNGCIYRGFKLNNQRHGHGVVIFADNGFYQGQFYQNNMEGQGKLYYNEKDLAYEGMFQLNLFSGQFMHNCFNGHGVLYNNNQQKLNGRFDFANMGNIGNFWVKYDGYFKDDQKSGKSHLYFTNGEEFEGFCQNNTFEGKGKFKTLEGDQIEGIWRNNVLIEIINETQAVAMNK